jgi:hypothetical protein
MLELGALAASLVGSFLVPLLKDGAEGLAEKLRERTTDAAADGLVGVAQRLWKRVRGKAAETGNDDVITVFEGKPETMQASVEQLVLQMLKDDEAFRAEVSGLVEGTEDGVARWQLMGETVGVVDARNAHIEGGIVAGVMVGNQAAPPPAKKSAPPAPED